MNLSPRRTTAPQPIIIHEDVSEAEGGQDGSSSDELDESGDPMEDSGCTRSEDSDDNEDEMDENVAADILKLEESFRGITSRYRLVDRIGEG